MVMVTIGLSIIFFGVGLFVGRLTAGPHVNKSDNFFNRAVENVKANLEQKKAEKAFAKEVKRQARHEAMKGMKDDLVKHYKEDERKKLTGEKRKEKMDKLKNAFSMDNMNTGDNLQSMLGTGGNNQSNNQGSSGTINENIARMMGGDTSAQPKQTNNKKKQSAVKKDLSFDEFLGKL